MPSPRVLTAKQPTKPLRSYFPRGPTKFKFIPQQGFRQFYFLFSNKLPESHSLLHTYFCKNYSCPWHHPYGS